MAEIKSAWEIAQEKASKLGELSPQERTRQKEERLQLIGTSLAEKYLSQGDVRLLEIELGKCSSQDRELVRKAALGRLVENIDLTHGVNLDEIVQGITALYHTEAVTQAVDKIRALFQEYHELEKKQRQEIYKVGREMLHQLRISGTAISLINIHAKGEWKKRLESIAQLFVERLNSLKQELLTAAGI